MHNKYYEPVRICASSSRYFLYYFPVLLRIRWNHVSCIMSLCYPYVFPWLGKLFPCCPHSRSFNLLWCFLKIERLWTNFIKPSGGKCADSVDTYIFANVFEPFCEIEKIGKELGRPSKHLKLPKGHRVGTAKKLYFHNVILTIMVTNMTWH